MLHIRECDNRLRERPSIYTHTHTITLEIDDQIHLIQERIKADLLETSKRTYSEQEKQRLELDEENLGNDLRMRPAFFLFPT